MQLATLKESFEQAGTVDAAINKDIAEIENHVAIITVSNKIKQVEQLSQDLNVKLTPIGTITKEMGLKRLGGFEKKCTSYRHF